jgi:hypothetical protein
MEAQDKGLRDLRQKDKKLYIQKILFLEVLAQETS